MARPLCAFRVTFSAPRFLGKEIFFFSGGLFFYVLGSRCVYLRYHVQAIAIVDFEPHQPQSNLLCRQHSDFKAPVCPRRVCPTDWLLSQTLGGEGHKRIVGGRSIGDLMGLVGLVRLKNVPSRSP